MARDSYNVGEGAHGYFVLRNNSGPCAICDKVNEISLHQFHLLLPLSTFSPFSSCPSHSHWDPSHPRVDFPSLSLPTYLPTYLLTYLPTYLFLLTYLPLTTSPSQPRVDFPAPPYLFLQLVVAPTPY